MKNSDIFKASMALTLKELNLSKRACKLLVKFGVKNVSQLLEKTWSI